MKSTVLIYSVALALVIGVTGAYAQSCDGCSSPIIRLFDADILAPRPSNADSLIAWSSLEYAMVAARWYFHSNDPSSNCVMLVDMAMIDSQSLQNGTLPSGLNSFNVPIPGEVFGSDYIVTGAISRSTDTTFIIELRLETAVSRELVMSRAAEFRNEPASKEAAGLAVAASMSPILQTIRTYEIDKRNADVTVAIRDAWNSLKEMDIKITPKQAQIKTGDSTDVDIEMIDCDGVPLSNREIRFDAQTLNGVVFPGSSGGTVEPISVTTDGNGKATVKFKSSATKGPGIINAVYMHKKPCGRDWAFVGHSTVAIRPRTFDVIIESAYQREDTYNYESGGVKDFVLRGTNAKTNLLFVYESYDTTGSADSLLWISYPPKQGDSVYGLTVTGFMTYVNWDKSKSVDAQGNLVQFALWANSDRGPAYVDSTSTTLEMSFSAVSKHLFFDPPYRWNGRGQNTLFNSQNGWTRDSWAYSDWGRPWSVGFSESSPGAQFQKLGRDYQINYTYSDVTIDSIIGRRTVKTSKSFDMMLMSRDNPNSVREGTLKIPNAFLLRDAYPNPFNPTTVISYQMPVASDVRLSVYDLLGREVAVLVNEKKAPGSYEVKFDGSNLASGVFLYRLTAGEFVQTRRLLLLK